MRGGGGGWVGVQNQREHHIILILTKYGVVHPTAVSENNSYKYNEQGPTTSEHYRRHKKFDYTYVADRLRLLSSYGRNHLKQSSLTGKN